MIVNETAPPNNLDWNRRIYQRLRIAVSLGLRRQIFIAVCDDLKLRNLVASRLQSTLAASRRHHYPANNTSAYPRLVSLRLNFSDPNPIAQIHKWLTLNPPPMQNASGDTQVRRAPLPVFQIVGVEELTKQPAAVQRLFLNYLRYIERYLPTLDTTLVLWVPRPWLHAIQQSAPQFWRCRTGVFSFVGEPRPTLPVQSDAQTEVDLFFHPTTPPAVAPKVAVQKETEQEVVNSTQIPTTPTRESVANLPEIPELKYVSQKLTALVLATINTEDLPEVKLPEDGNRSGLQPWELLLSLEELHAQNKSESELADAYHQLGNLYRDRVEQGESTPEHLMVAILAYEEAISYFEDYSPQLPDILNDLGTLYWLLYRRSPHSEGSLPFLQQAIQVYQLDLNLIQAENNPQTYARVQNNLGAAYGDLALVSDPAQNWDNAVKAYNEALRYRSASVDPVRYASSQNNLGTAYWHLAQHNQPVLHLKQAIAAYTEALVYYNPQEQPLNYGMIHNNIGTAYWNLAQHEQSESHLQFAVDAYREALKYRTPAVVPAACAATQNNLGTAIWHLANQPQTTKEAKSEYLLLSIEAYEEALALAHSLGNSAMNFNVFATHNNLGIAHYQLVTDKYFSGDKSTLTKHLEASLQNHLQALQGYEQGAEGYETTVAYIAKTVRTFHDQLGLQGQNLALSKIPGTLLPELLPKL
ncbi:MAG: tetratricopeptide repeat protein [Nostocaceae cyanobacterium]|nr:tetratricopeptide repeat protein [Nostocaceae cyanobacterium]